VLLGTAVSSSSLGFIDAFLSRVTIFSVQTEGFCKPPPCHISIGGSAFYGQVGLLIFAMILLRFLPQGVSGYWKRWQ
jgi:hypothetical protein